MSTPTPDTQDATLLLFGSIIPPFPLVFISHLLYTDRSIPESERILPTPGRTIAKCQVIYAIWLLMLILFHFYFHHAPTSDADADETTRSSRVQREAIFMGKCISANIGFWFLWWASWDYRRALPPFPLPNITS
jgi:hypothetical protein